MPQPIRLVRAVLAHQGDSADAELLHWIKDRLDETLGLEPWVVVALIAAIIVLVPAAVMLAYYLRQRRRSDPDQTHPGGAE